VFIYRPLRETNVYGSDMEERLGWYDTPETSDLLRHIDEVKTRQQQTQLCFEDMVEHRRKSTRLERIAKANAEKPEPEEPAESPEEIAARVEKEKKEKAKAARKAAVKRLHESGIDMSTGKTRVMTIDDVLAKLCAGLPPPSKTSDEITRGPDKIDVVLAQMATRTQCGKHRWDTVYEGWNVFQLAAREGLGEALDNLHSNCVDRSSVLGYGRFVRPAPTAVTWQFLVDSTAPDGRNMIHLIAAGWKHLRDRDLTEATQLGKALAGRMTKNQLHAAGGDDGDTCLHALAAAGANTRNLMKYVLDRGGYEMLEMRNGGGAHAAGVRPRESRGVENGRRRRGSETGEDTAPARHRGPGGGGRHQAKADGQVPPHEVRVDVLHRGAGVGGEDRGSTAGAEEPEEPQETEEEADGGG
jgi:hypothetical protein